MRRAKDQPILALFLAAGTVVVLLATFTDSVNHLARVLDQVRGERPFFSTLHTVRRGVYPGVYFYASEPTKTLTAVGVMMNVEVTNLRSDQTRVQAHAVDVRVEDEWHRLGNLELAQGEMIHLAMDGDLHKCAPLAPLDLFAARAATMELQAGGSLRGWMFFEWPGSLRRYDQPPNVEGIRLWLRNSQGEEMYAEPALIEVEGLDPRTGGGAFYFPNDRFRDFSSYRLMSIMDRY